jgi:hypothetical protein
MWCSVWGFVHHISFYNTKLPFQKHILLTSSGSRHMKKSMLWWSPQNTAHIPSFQGMSVPALPSSGGNCRNKFCWAPYYSYAYTFRSGYESPSTKGLNKVQISSYPCNLKMEIELTSETLPLVYIKVRTMYKVQENKPVMLLHFCLYILLNRERLPTSWRHV